MATSNAARSASGSITMLDPSGATSRDARPATSMSGGTIISGAPGASSDGGYTAVSSSGSTPAATTLGGDAARRNVASGPAQRHAPQATQVDDVGGRSGRHDRDHLAQARLHLGRRHVGIEHPAAHATTVERHPHDRADSHVARQRVRERVVERAVDCGNVGLNATNPRVPQALTRAPSRPCRARRRRRCAPT